MNRTSKKELIGMLKEYPDEAEIVLEVGTAKTNIHADEQTVGVESMDSYDGVIRIFDTRLH